MMVFWIRMVAMEVVRISNEGSENWILYCISNTDMIEFAIGLDAGMEL